MKKIDSAQLYSCGVSPMSFSSPATLALPIQSTQPKTNKQPSAQKEKQP